MAYKEVENVTLSISFVIRYSRRRRSGKEFLVMRRTNSPSNNTEGLHRKSSDIMISLCDGEYGPSETWESFVARIPTAPKEGGLSLGGSFEKGMKTHQCHPRDRLQSSYQEEPRTSHLQE